MSFKVKFEFESESSFILKKIECILKHETSRISKVSIALIGSLVAAAGPEIVITFPFIYSLT